MFINIYLGIWTARNKLKDVQYLDIKVIVSAFLQYQEKIYTQEEKIETVLIYVESGNYVESRKSLTCMYQDHTSIRITRKSLKIWNNHLFIAFKNV